MSHGAGPRLCSRGRAPEGAWPRISAGYRCLRVSGRDVRQHQRPRSDGGGEGSDATARRCDLSNISRRTRTMNDALFTSDAKLTPYWWDTVQMPRFEKQLIPPVADVAVIGSGYTGLNA